MVVHSQEDVLIKDTNFEINRYLLSYLFCAFSYFAISLIFNNKTTYKILMILDIILSVLMYADLIYFRSFESYISIYNIFQYKLFGIIGSSALALIKPLDIIIFIDPILLIVFHKKLLNLVAGEENKSIKVKLIFMVYLIFCGFIISRYDEIFSPKPTKIETGAKLSIIGYHYYDIDSFINDLNKRVSKNSVKNSIEDYFKIKNTNVGKVSDFGVFKDKNVIFLQVESLENFVINKSVDGQEITPNLNKLLKNSYYFNNVHEQVNEGNSSDADFMVNTSILPLRNGAQSYLYPYNHYNSLPVLLREDDYHSIAIHSGKSYFWNKNVYLPNLGFDEVIDIDGMKANKEDMFFMGLKDDANLQQVAQLCNEQKNKYYLFTVTETSHTPFKIPEEMQTLKLDDSINNTVVGRYYQAVHYTDSAIGNFIDTLDKDNQLDNTIIVIYGDHEGLHKYTTDATIEKEVGNVSDYENDGKIPLIIYSKGMIGEEISKVGGEIDIMPTVLSLLGVDKKEYQDTAMGNNLLEDNIGYVIENNGIILGNVDKDMAANIKKSFSISDKIIKSNYFSDYYIESSDFKYNHEIKK
jgi:phosphoglycerol transferase MdoB-like AlkP superfamily enzyme